MAAHKKPARRDALAALHADLLMTDDGLKGGGVRIGRSAGVMHNKFSDAVPHSEVTHHEAVALAHYVREQTGSTAFVEAECADFGGVFVSLPSVDADDEDMLDDQMEAVMRFGDMSRELMESRADGVVDPDEYAAFRSRGHKTIRAILHWMANVQTRVREMPPATRTVPLAEVRRA